MKKPTHYVVTFRLEMPIALVEKELSEKDIEKSFESFRQEMLEDCPKGASVTCNVTKEYIPDSREKLRKAFNTWKGRKIKDGVYYNNWEGDEFFNDEGDPVNFGCH